MNVHYNAFFVSDDKSLIQTERVHELLSNTYWAATRSKETIKKSIENSLCFGLYQDGILVGFARCVTDYSTIYWVADVIVDEKYRGQGLGKLLIKSITEHEKLSNLVGILGTKDAHGLYEKFGFQLEQGTSMRKSPDNTALPMNSV